MKKYLNREDIVPGATLTVKEGYTLVMNPHRRLFGESWEMLDRGVSHVVSLPRKDADGNFLVRLKVNSIEEFDAFYCDVLWCCEINEREDQGDVRR